MLCVFHDTFGGLAILISLHRNSKVRVQYYSDVFVGVNGEIESLLLFVKSGNFWVNDLTFPFLFVGLDCLFVGDGLAFVGLFGGSFVDLHG